MNNSNIKIVIGIVDSMSGSKYDLNGACIEEKQGTGLTSLADQEKLQSNIQSRFGLDLESAS